MRFNPIRVTSSPIISFCFLLLVVCCFSSYADAGHSPLIKKGESALFSFRIAGSEKILTIAVSADDPGYIVYRYGSPQKIELEFPQDKTDSWGKFVYSFYFRGRGPENAGLDLNYLTFVNRDYTYTVYQEYDAEKNKNIVGVKIKNNIDKKELDIKGDYSTVIGSLIPLRDEQRIKMGED